MVEGAELSTALETKSAMAERWPSAINALGRGSRRCGFVSESTGTLWGRRAAEQSLDIGLEWGKVALDGAPDDVEVDPPVLMYENVALTSGEVGRQGWEVPVGLVGEGAECFSDHGQATEDGISGLVVVEG